MLIAANHGDIAVMAVKITIRDVPEDVRDAIASRAAQRNQSMQAYLRQELERIASRPPMATWLQAVRARKAISGAHVSASEILRARDMDRQ